MRPPLSPWCAFAKGWQRTLRKPYRDAEVMTVGDCWRYDVRTMTGHIEVIGVRPTRLEAMAAATSHLLRVKSEQVSKDLRSDV
tara:strand:- start:1684 stop:1932 length:249 start_codon:yes stop_codon:yes gene_type:complete